MLIRGLVVVQEMGIVLFHQLGEVAQARPMGIPLNSHLLLCLAYLSL